MPLTLFYLRQKLYIPPKHTPAMAIIKTHEERELSAIQKVEKEMQRHIRMERLHHVIMGALGALAVGAFFAGRSLRR